MHKVNDTNIAKKNSFSFKSTIEIIQQNIDTFLNITFFRWGAGFGGVNISPLKCSRQVTDIQILAEVQTKFKIKEGTWLLLTIYSAMHMF